MNYVYRHNFEIKTIKQMIYNEKLNNYKYRIYQFNQILILIFKILIYNTYLKN